MSSKTIVLDTSVIIDMFLSERKRHPEALELAKLLRTHDFRPTLPCHAFLEIACAIRNERMFSEGGAPISEEVFTKKFPLALNIIVIDMEFVHNYLDHTLPYLKAGDLIFIAIAKKQGLALITEDNIQYNKAAEAHVKAFRIKEFLEYVKKNPIE